MKSNRPVIGITSSVLDIEILGETNPCVQANHQFVKAVLDAGGMPIIIPVGNRIMARQCIELCDGLFLTSGEDVFPMFYDEKPTHLIKMINVGRDHMERMLIKYAMKKRIPIIGVCRGFGSLNTALGGSMVQDIESDVRYIQHNQMISRKEPTHDLHIKEGTLLHRLMGISHAKVNSKHHQAVKRVADPCRVVATAPDGIIEAIEGKDPTHFILGLQFHPEELYEKDDSMRQLLKGYIEACHQAKSSQCEQFA
ncbi:gamma-glutamyl-gamma-aminobutyrate hydrolase family protein [Bacillus testis]|uniref:gamma-glutamyl-gamma-aminobutyrate hydrolase family protein n=1 Tax=Bacillus testis TaxID=1622072 RepID=UPI00067E8816|nr:gamma-glutamyl-gamma-aminobutyrate hydrolase family protein [Bacillus testis]